MTTRTQWIIYKPDDTSYKLKEQSAKENDEFYQNVSHVHPFDDEGYTLKRISRSESEDQQQGNNNERFNEQSRYIYALKTRVFSNKKEKDLLKRMDDMYKHQKDEEVGSDLSSDGSTAVSTVWSSFKQQPIQLLKVSKSGVSMEKVTNAATTKEEKKQKDSTGFKRINASFSSSLRHQRKKAVNTKRKRSDSDSDSSSSEDDSVFNSIAVSYDDIVKKR